LAGQTNIFAFADFDHLALLSSRLQVQFDVAFDLIEELLAGLEVEIEPRVRARQHHDNELRIMRQSRGSSEGRIEEMLVLSDPELSGCRAKSMLPLSEWTGRAGALARFALILLTMHSRQGAPDAPLCIERRFLSVGRTRFRAVWRAAYASRVQAAERPAGSRPQCRCLGRSPADGGCGHSRCCKKAATLRLRAVAALLVRGVVEQDFYSLGGEALGAGLSAQRLESHRCRRPGWAPKERPSIGTPRATRR
jgi:hypothetical protein